MSEDFDKRQWQAEQAARDAALDKQREKAKKARARSARNAQRKIDRLRETLKENGNLTDWEDAFSENVSERLDKFGSAFQDPEKGYPGDALSFAQKKVLSALKAKVKSGDKDDHKNGFKPRSSFKPKGKKTYQPRVRHIEDDMEDESGAEDQEVCSPAKPPVPIKRKPFLRIVKND